MAKFQELIEIPYLCHDDHQGVQVGGGAYKKKQRGNNYKTCFVVLLAKPYSDRLCWYQ